MRSEWVSYLLGAGLTLVFKWGRYVWVGKEQGKTISHATGEWFFDGSTANAVSWVTTVGVVWVFGTAYLDQVVWMFGNWPQSIPRADSIAFFLGSLMELIAPAAVKWVVSKLPIPDTLAEFGK